MHLPYKQTSSGPNPEFPTRAFAQINKRKVIKMDEYLFDLEDYFYHVYESNYQDLLLEANNNIKGKVLIK